MEYRFLLILLDRQRRVHLDGRDARLRLPARKGDTALFARLGGRQHLHGADVFGPSHHIDATQTPAGDVDHDEGPVTPLEIHGAVQPARLTATFTGDGEDVGLRVPMVADLGKLAVERLDARLDAHATATIQ